ncbi:acyl-CoA dehydrogenase family protein [Nocardia noduli]|uniref:acyl-CoA dehydrogenase family protein n=1 Tax=Nocardia noduli TaxID=2815722 RepID=UPI0020B1C649|nr:acyl-CoA dehydrogenase family protein [Nocardia noduli]
MKIASSVRAWGPPDPVVSGLGTAILGGDLDMQMWIRDIVAGLADRPASGQTHPEEARLGPALLRQVLADLAVDGSVITANARMRAALCNWSMIASPHLLPILTGHFDLAIGAILALGDRSDYQQQMLADLETGAAIGVFALTELGGTNGANQRTTATWDSVRREIVLSTPDISAAKFMPNLADPTIPKIVVATARLIVEGRDEGVLPFLIRLRRPDGLADGVEVTALPDKAGAPMDHAMIQFDDVRLPRQALLGSGLVAIAETGALTTQFEPPQRFHIAISVLGHGRLDLANAAAAAARAALAGLVNYGGQRAPGGKRLIDRDAVRLDAATALSAIYATTVFGRRVGDLDPDDPQRPIFSTLAKILLPDTAREVVAMCADRLGAQGTLRINHYADWLAAIAGLRIAEGETQVLAITTGRSRGVDLPTLHLPDTLDPTTTGPSMPWWLNMLIAREKTLAAAVHGAEIDSANVGLGPDSTAIESAVASAERMAVTAILSTVAETADPTARRLLDAMTTVYALDRIRLRGHWYTAHDLMSPKCAIEIAAELSRFATIITRHLNQLAAAFAIPQLPGPVHTSNYIDAWDTYRNTVGGWTALDARQSR